MLIILLSVAYEAESSAERFLVDPEKNAVFPNRSSSINSAPHTSPGNPSVIADINGYEGSDSPPEDKPHRPGGYRLKAILIDSISRQFLYAIYLLVGYEKILNTRSAPLNATPSSWPSLEMVIAAGWFLNSYWNSDSPSFNPMKQQKATFMSTQENQAFTSITMMFGSGNNQQPYQQQDLPSDSSGQHAPVATRCLTSLPYAHSGGGNEDPQQQQHTLGFNCFVFPCHGLCRFRHSSDGRGPAESQLSSFESSCHHLAYGHCLSCIGYVDPVDATSQNSHFERLNPLPAIQPQSISDLPFELLTCDIDDNPYNSGNSIEGVTSDSIRAGAALRIDAIGTLNDDMPMPENNCLATGGAPTEGVPSGVNPPEVITDCQQPSGNHKSNNHILQRTCVLTLVGKDGKTQSCAKIFKNARSLSNHKSRFHRGQKICDMTVFGEDGQSRPCGKSCLGTQGLSDHKRSSHSGQQTCFETVVGKDGQPRPCGKVFENAKSLSNHKGKIHTGQKTCDVIVVGEDGQHRPCGVVFKNTGSLSSHKTGYHTAQKTCDILVIDKDGQPRLCGKVCKNVQSLSSHKSAYHSGDKTCDIIVVEKDGKPQPCGKIFINAHSFSQHKRRHRRRKFDALQRDNNLNP
ncbi:hypothetical protein [Endozoicomonas sp. SESOKO3]|uniref:hypothetical protein n=1 Tax=Endozoicomonas sp. SESOKO3 TaxID=2828744 RepID=UPI00214919FE|nr:hypothetical protein [Endozoicomonas sp. SESOKO3]